MPFPTDRSTTRRDESTNNDANLTSFTNVLKRRSECVVAKTEFYVLREIHSIQNVLRGVRVLAVSQTVCLFRHIQKPAPVLVLNLVCNGAGPTLFLTASKEDSAPSRDPHFEELAQLHQSFLEGNQCLVVAMGEDTELFLAPVKSTGTEELVFWGYAVMRGAVAHVTEMLDTGRIPLVFDLDETLVLAHTIFSLRTRESQLSAEISAQEGDPSTPEKYCFLSFLILLRNPVQIGESC